MLGLQRARLLFFPFLSQLICIPLVLMRGRRKQSDRERVEVNLFQDAVDQIGPPAALVYVIEDITCILHRQGGNVETLAGGGNSGDARRDAEADVTESTQFLHHSIDPLGICSLWVENGLGVIKDHEKFPGRYGLP